MLDVYCTNDLHFLCEDIVQPRYLIYIERCVPSTINSLWRNLFPVVVVVTPPLPRDGSTARTTIQAHAVNLIELGLGKGGSPFRTSREWLIAPPPTRQTTIVGYPRVASYDMLGEQLYNSNPVKYGYATCLPHKDGGIPLSALSNDTPRIAWRTSINTTGLFSTLSLFLW